MRIGRVGIAHPVPEAIDYNPFITSVSSAAACIMAPSSL
jgi:hypothetical protein